MLLIACLSLLSETLWNSETLQLVWKPTVYVILFIETFQYILKVICFFVGLQVPYVKSNHFYLYSAFYTDCVIAASQL